MTRIARLISYIKYKRERLKQFFCIHDFDLYHVTPVGFRGLGPKRSRRKHESDSTHYYCYKCEKSLSVEEYSKDYK